MENQTPLSTQTDNSTTNQTPPPNSTPVPPQPSGTPTQPVKTGHKFPKALIFGILAFLTLAGAAFAFKDQVMKMVSKPTPTPAPTEVSTKVDNPTANWKTYTNPEKGYSLKYSKEIFARKLCPGEELLLQLRANGVDDDTKEAETCARDSAFDFESVTTTSSKAEPKTTGIFKVTQTEMDVVGLRVRKYITTHNDPDSVAPPWKAEAYIDYGSKKYQFSFTIKDKEEVFNQIISTFRIAGSTISEKHTNASLGISFFVMDPNEVLKEEAGKIEIGYKPDNRTFLIVSTKDITDYKTIKLCSQVPESTPDICIAEDGWSQKEPIEKIKLDGRDAVSFYLTSHVPDFARHIIQTTSTPIIELNMNVAGGGLAIDRTIKDFKFTN